MENKARGHRQRRSENQQMDKHPERVLTRRQLFSSGFLPDGITNCNDAGGDKWVQDGTTRRKRPKENTQSIH